MGDWRKSTYSDGNGGQCVEVASDSVILVRDTQDRQGVNLSVAADAWQRFTASLRLDTATEDRYRGVPLPAHSGPRPTLTVRP